jgi:hypothetical protein
MAFRFKGGEPIVEKKKKKKGKKQLEERVEESSSTSSSNWIICRDIEYLKGPVLIMDLLHSALLNHVAGTDKVSFKPPPPRFDTTSSGDHQEQLESGGLENGGGQMDVAGSGISRLDLLQEETAKQHDQKDALITSLESAEPWAASQVWIVHPYVGGRFTIKS